MHTLALCEKPDSTTAVPNSTAKQPTVVSIVPAIQSRNTQKERDKQVAADILFSIKLFLDRNKPSN